MVYIHDVSKLRAEIIKKGFNFSKFSKRLGISRSALDKIFKRGTISPIIAKKICDEFSTDFENFFYIDGV